MTKLYLDLQLHKSQINQNCNYCVLFFYRDKLRNISSSVSLEGGADVKFAKAGVDGVFSIASARMSGNGLVALTKDKDGKLAFCYNGNIKLAVTEVLGGKLTAYAQLGKPEKSLGKLPLGWRGDMNFVNWAGTSHELSILKTEDQCFPADSQSAL